MPRRGENIYKRKDGRWEGRCPKEKTVNGKSKYKYLYADSYTGVKEKIKNYSTQKQTSALKKQEDLYSDIIDSWLAEKRPAVKASTYEKYLYEAEARLRPGLGNIPISELTLNRIEEYVRKLQNMGKGLSPKTVSDIVVIIKDTFNFMKSWGFSSVCELKRLKIRVPQKEMRVFSLEEQEKLVGFLVSDLDISKCGILLSLYTGIRLGELCALKWKNVSAGEKTIEIKGTIQRLKTDFEKRKANYF